MEETTLSRAFPLTGILNTVEMKCPKCLKPADGAEGLVGAGPLTCSLLWPLSDDTGTRTAICVRAGTATERCHFPPVFQLQWFAAGIRERGWQGNEVMEDMGKRKQVALTPKESISLANSNLFESN